MPIKNSKPTVEEILELYDDCVSKYSVSGIDTQFADDEKLYELDFKSELLLPDEFKQEGIVLPTARDLVDTCVDHTDVFNARVFVNRKGTSKKSEDEQNLLRKFGLGVLYRNNVEATVAPIRVAAKHYWLHGLGIIKTVWDADRWMDKPEQKKGESDIEYAVRIDEWRAMKDDSIPIVMQGIYPGNVMFDPYGTEQYVFETNEELAFNVRQQFPGWKNPQGKKAAETVDHISFWTKDWRCELYDRQAIKLVHHTYGFIPYVPIDTGLGNINRAKDMKKRYVGVLRYVRDLLLSESRDYSIGDVILKRTAFPWGYLKGPNAGAVKDIFQKFGEYNPLPDGVDIVDMAPKVPPQALLTWLSVASEYLAGHAAPNAVRGMGEEGVRSGSDRRQLIAEASVRYQYSNEAFRNGVAKALSNCARIMKNVVPGDISVWAKTPTDEFDIEIKKAEMTEPFTFYVEFAPVSEEDEYRRHDDLERLYKSGLVTASWARKQMSNVDPQEMDLEVEIEKLKNSPMVQTVMEQYAAGKIMEAMTKRSQAESLENPPPAPVFAQEQGLGNAGATPAGSGAPGRRLVPPNLEITTPGSAQGLQNQMAQNRSQKPMNPTQGLGGGGRP